MTATPAHDWQNGEGRALECREKTKLLDANLREIAVQCQDALDDALLMGCSTASFKAGLQQMILELTPTVKERS